MKLQKDKPTPYRDFIVIYRGRDPVSIEGIYTYNDGVLSVPFRFVLIVKQQLLFSATNVRTIFMGKPCSIGGFDTESIVLSRIASQSMCIGEMPCSVILKPRDLPFGRIKPPCKLIGASRNREIYRLGE